MTSNDTATLRANETAVRRVFAEVSRAWAEGDADTFADWYADGATAVLPGVYLGDKEAIRRAMGVAFATSLRGSRRVHDVRSIRFLDDHVAIVATDSATILGGEAEPARERREWATWVLARHGDGWLIEAYHGCPADAA